MRNFKRNDRRGGGRRFSGHNRGPVTMYPAVCSNCGQDCEVPFKPTGSKPIFCSNCFKGKAGDRGGRSDTRRFAPRGSDNQRQLEEINAKLDKILKALQA